MTIGSVVKPYAVGALAGVAVSAPAMAATGTAEASRVIGVLAVLGVSLLLTRGLIWLHDRGWVVFSTEPREWLF